MANPVPTPTRRPFGNAPGRDWSKMGKWLTLVATLLIVSGGGILATTFASAASAPTLVATPDTGLTNGASTMLTGTGYADSSTGNILECNNAPDEPTVALGGLVDSSVSVGCTGPSFAANSLVSTSATGTLSKAYTVTAGTVGPPCGATNDIIATCPTTDSTGGSTTTDAAAYPCPPTAAQQAAGVTCSLSFGDQANDSSSVTIFFEGETTGTTTTTEAPTTTPPSTTSTVAPTTTTTGVSSTTTTTGVSSTTTTTGVSSTTTTTEAPTTTTTEAPTTTTTEAPTTTTTEAPTTTTTAAPTTTTTAPSGPTTTLPAVADTGAYELYCPGTPVGNVVLNGVTTSAALTPLEPTSGSSFMVTNYQTIANVPQALAQAAQALGNSALTGSATTQLDVTGATPATLSSGSISFSAPFPTTIPASGLTLDLPAPPASLGPFTATNTNITVEEDAGASLTLEVSGSPLTLTCTAYPNNAAPTGITTTPPTGSPFSPIIAFAGQGAPMGTLTSTATPSCTTGTACSIALTGTGFAPSETVDLALNDPASLGSTTADANGDISDTVMIPASTAAGTYSVVATGETSGTTASFAFTEAAAATTTTTAASSATTAGNVVTSSANSLAFTGVGAGVGWLGVVGGALVLLGLAMLFLVDAPRRLIGQLAYVNLGKLARRHSPRWALRPGAWSAAVKDRATRVGSWIIGR